MDNSNECNFAAPHGRPTEQDKRMHCYQNNTVIANGFIRRLASALPSMARAAGAPQDVQWLEIAQNMDPLPTVLDDAQIGRVYTLAGEYDGSTCKRPKPRQSIGNCGTRMAAPGQDECEACGSRPPGSQNVNTWHVFPGEVTSLASPAEERQIAINTLRNDAPWAQGNSFSSAFSQAARVGMPVHEWLPELHKMISSSMRNFVVYQGGGGVEVAGALQMVSDLMLQSITKADGSGDSYMALFPLDVVHTDLQFHRLRGKGGFVVSARWCKAKEQLDGAIELHSEAGERCKFLLPRPAGSVDVTVGSGATVHFTLTNQTWLSFDTVAGADYRIVVHARAQLLVATPQVPSPAKSAQAPKYTGGHTLWNVYTEHMAVPTRSRSLDIRQFGGRGDGVHDNTNAFSAAMHAARVTPGGAEVVVPSGVWLTAPFNLTSHLTLNVTHGATLLASEDPMAWPIIAPLPSYGQGRDHPGPRRTSFLHGVHVSDVVLCGGGTIDGQGSAWWKRRSNGSETVTRGRLFEVEWSDGILLQDLLFTNSPFWTLHPVYSTNIVARRLNVSNPLHSPNTDGFDPDSCENVTFVDSFYSGGDDAVAIKSGWDCFGTSYARPSRHISIRNLTVRSPHAAGICIGSEMSGGVEDVTVQDVVMHDVGEGLRIKASRTRGGYVRNVSYSNITITSFRERAIQVNDFYGVPNPSCAGVNATSPDPPRISGIRFIGVHARHNLGTKSAADFEGLDASPIASVWLEDVSLPGAGGDGAGGADGGGGASAWTCKRVAGHSINVQPRPCAELAACATAGQGRSLHSFFSTTEPTVDGRLEPYECAPTCEPQPKQHRARMADLHCARSASTSQVRRCHDVYQSVRPTQHVDV